MSEKNIYFYDIYFLSQQTRFIFLVKDCVTMAVWLLCETDMKDVIARIAELVLFYYFSKHDLFFQKGSI